MLTIRNKLIITMSLLLMASMSLLGYGIVLVNQSYKRSDMEKSTKVIENSVQRVALDALLQKDDLQLVSYVNFLKAQYPALAYARMEWRTEDRTRAINLGESPPPRRTLERQLEVSDPANAQHRVSIRLGIDEDVLEQSINESRWRLQKIIFIIWAAMALVGVGLSWLLARTMTEPLYAVGRLAREIGSGKLGARLEWKSDDEIGQLVKVFNTMSEKLEELDEAKKNFVTSVTHELRSPLGAMESFLALVSAKLKSGSYADVKASGEYLERIRINMQRLQRFVGELLDAAKIEKGSLECVLAPMRLDAVVADACQFFGAKAKELGVGLEHRVANLPPVLGDSERIRQVLVNLISNSLKFTPSGGRISISAEQFREKERRWLEVSVQDTGLGIDQKDLARLFQAFSQGKNSMQRVAGGKGTGLGLYICKSIVEKHGGRMEAKSAPGKGARFSFTLPVAG